MVKEERWYLYYRQSIQGFPLSHEERTDGGWYRPVLHLNAAFSSQLEALEALETVENDILYVAPAHEKKFWPVSPLIDEWYMEKHPHMRFIVLPVGFVYSSSPVVRSNIYSPWYIGAIPKTEVYTPGFFGITVLISLPGAYSGDYRIRI
jgi:hypothetical protein